MSQTTTVDFAAVARVSKQAELKDVRIVEISAKSDTSGATGPLTAEFFHEGSLAASGVDFLNANSNYRFVGSFEGVQVLEISLKYLVSYEIKGTTEPLAETDLAEFARANGTLHSWPFARESLNGITYRMGFPPFKLGVMHFVPLKAAEKKSAPESGSTEPDTGSKKES